VRVRGTHCDGLFWSAAEYTAAVRTLLERCATHDGAAHAMEAPAAPLKACEHWRSKGRCKFGAECRFHHGETLAAMTSVHPHALGPPSDVSASRRKAFCDACGGKCKGGWQCTDGCDFVLCEPCVKVQRLAG
jgi:hypothetical protein